MVDFDKSYLNDNIKIIAGIDEAGRGPLAGPVSVAIVAMPLNNVIEGVNDSKKLTEKKRDKLYDEIKQKAYFYHVELVDEKTIDDINILAATKKGMNFCAKTFADRYDFLLVDAVKLDGIENMDNIIKGDAKSYNIACASILAKVTRDRYMLEMDKKYPQYNFAKHKGYGTKEHIENLKKYGKCEIHRDSFISHFV